MVWNGQIVTVPFRDQDSGLGAERSRNSAEQRVVIRILLLEDVEILVAGKINSLVLRIVYRVIHQANGGQICYHLAVIGIHNNQFSRGTGDDKQAMVGFVESHRDIRLVASGQGPGRGKSRLVAVHYANGVFASQIDEHAGAGLFQNDSLDMIRQDLDVPEL